MHSGCPMGMNPAPEFLCTALARLKEEHGPLVEKMMELQKQSKQIAVAQGLFKEELLQNLQKKAADFIAQLEPHSEKEESLLFPMLAKYIGRETGPIAVMEYEHEQAKSNLKRFREDGFPDDLNSAVEILLQHFQKEEQVLFPMAQQMLTDGEKQELLDKMKAIR